MKILIFFYSMKRGQSSVRAIEHTCCATANNGSKPNTVYCKTKWTAIFSSPAGSLEYAVGLCFFFFVFGVGARGVVRACGGGGSGRREWSGLGRSKSERFTLSPWLLPVGCCGGSGRREVLFSL